MVVLSLIKYNFIVIYLCGAVVLFILFVNPLSVMLRKFEDYLTHSQGNRNTKVRRSFFVDDLKLVSKNRHKMKKILHLHTTFSKDIRLELRMDKCFNMDVQKMKTQNHTGKISINSTNGLIFVLYYPQRVKHIQDKRGQSTGKGPVDWYLIY